MPSTHHGVLVHVIFSTKQRFKLIDSSWQDDLYAYIGGVVKEHKSFLVKAGGVEDHVHLLLKVNPRFAIADTVKLIKGNASRWINQEKKINAKFSWQRGYGVFSVSESMAPVVSRYIENQREHHGRVSFENEYFGFLKKHNVDFDKRYVFDDEIFG